MANQHGEFIWYELMTRDPEAATAFYEDVVGWRIGERAPGDDMDYRMIGAGSDFIGGLFHLSDAMCEQGARPVWLGYIGVDDVDATATKLKSLGGSVLMPAKDIPEVGQLAMVADPEGNPFYIMRGAVEGGTSTAFKAMAVGHCGWNELTTKDQAGALAFYGELFSWENKESMPMGEMGEYKLIHHNDELIGAVCPSSEATGSPMWTYYFRVEDIDSAKQKAEIRGGTILHGPHEVPGGDHIIIGTDPEGAMFALVGPKAK